MWTQGAGETAGPLVPEIIGMCSTKEPSFLLPATCAVCAPTVPYLCPTAGRLHAEILETSLDSASLIQTEHRLGSQAACQNCHPVWGDHLQNASQQQLIQDKVAALLFLWFFCPEGTWADVAVLAALHTVAGSKPGYPSSSLGQVAHRDNWVWAERESSLDSRPGRLFW